MRYQGTIGDVRRNVEEHAIRLAVAKGLALCVGFAERAAGSVCILGSARLKVVCCYRLDVAGDTTTWAACRCAVVVLADGRSSLFCVLE